MTFYPYLSRIHQNSNLRRLKIQLIIIGAFFSVSYFVFNVLVTEFVPKYLNSLKIIGILFASFPAFAVINALYINMYKVQKDGKKYINVIFINLFFSLVLIIVAVFIKKSLISVALASTIAYYLWMYYSSKDFVGLIPTLKEILFICLYLIIYFIAVLLFNPYWAILFFGSLMVLLSLLYKDEVGELLNKLLSFLKVKS
jgi:O-antigen/teichoic acid export membrane protein